MGVGVIVSVSVMGVIVGVSVIVGVIISGIKVQVGAFVRDGEGWMVAVNVQVGWSGMIVNVDVAV